jgi:hypothetical protein
MIKKKIKMEFLCGTKFSHALPYVMNDQHIMIEQEEMQS